MVGDRASGVKENGLFYPSAVAFSVSFGTLLLQLVQTRIFGVILWNHLVYFIVSIALLGFGISGTWLAFGKESFLARFLTLRNAAIGFVISTILASLVAPIWASDLAPLSAGAGRSLVRLLVTYSVAVFPYFFAGWMLGTVFRDYSKRIFLLYSVDLIGAGLGCLVFLGAMQPLGAVHLVLLVCAVVAIPPLAKEIRQPYSKAWSVGVVVALVLLGWFEPRVNARIVPELTKAFHRLYDNLGPNDERVWEFSEWNTISRIDVVGHVNQSSDPPRTNKRIFIDGDAWTGMVLGEWWKSPHTPGRGNLIGPSAPYYFYWDDLDSVLVVGSGGGPDLAMAIWGQAKRVDAIEINPTTYRLMIDEYRDQSNDLFFQPGVHAYNEEGRSFIRRSHEKYDLITMTGIDTFAALNSGAYVLSENYLYTVEAIKDYLTHLSGRGMLCITRWLHPAETLRLFVVCYEALDELGYADPGRHILLQGSDRATIMVRLEPYTDVEIDGYSDYALKKKGRILYPPHPDHEGIALVREFVESKKAGRSAEFLAGLPFDVTAVNDDSPFFFHFDRLSEILNAFRYRNNAGEMIRGAWPSFTLFVLLAFTLVATFLFMFLPLRWRERPKIPGFGLWLLYFSCLGVSFIFIEIALMQRFALLLGHPSRSLALVLASLLVFAGFGSYLRGRLNIDVRLALGLLIPLILTAAYLYPFAVDAALSWSLPFRAILTIGLVAPLGILMGMPFPTGIREVSEWGPEAVPWMWGVNGGTTVVGSILAIIIAIWVNFTTVILLAGAGYAVALGVYVAYGRIRAVATGS